MKISGMLFRFRSWVLTLLIVVGFWSPWERIGGAHPGTTWLFLAGLLTRYRIFSIANSSIAVMAAAILLAVLAALLRTWAAAYLGRGVVEDSALHGEQVVPDGPYRWVRNPLYTGTGLHTLALAILMPPGGALFAVVAVTLLNLALVRGEEQHLQRESGEAYAAYARKVPRFLPALTARIAVGGTRPRWGDALVGELYFWGVAITYIAFASRYNVTILEQGVLISLGVGALVEAAVRPAATKRA